MTDDVSRVAAIAEGRTTAEVAAICGVTVSTIRKWNKRGDLPAAPKGRAGQGRGNESFWSVEAVQQALARSREARTTGHRRAHLSRDGRP